MSYGVPSDPESRPPAKPKQSRSPYPTAAATDSLPGKQRPSSQNSRGFMAFWVIAAIVFIVAPLVYVGIDAATDNKATAMEGIADHPNNLPTTTTAPPTTTTRPPATTTRPPTTTTAPSTTYYPTSVTVLPANNFDAKSGYFCDWVAMDEAAKVFGGSTERPGSSYRHENGVIDNGLGVDEGWSTSCFIDEVTGAGSMYGLVAKVYSAESRPGSFVLDDWYDDFVGHDPTENSTQTEIPVTTLSVDRAKCFEYHGYYSGGEVRVTTLVARFGKRSLELSSENMDLPGPGITSCNQLIALADIALERVT